MNKRIKVRKSDKVFALVRSYLTNEKDKALNTEINLQYSQGFI